MSATQPSKADLRRQRAEEEKARIAAMERKAAATAGDVVTHIGSTSTQGSGTSVPDPPSPPAPDTSKGPRAHGPITQQKPDRQGINLRPSDRERVYAFDIFCMRMKLGKKKGLTLYARAGLQLLEQLIEERPEAARDLLKSL